jgi:hypothetical protein
MAARALPDSNPIAARLSTGRASGHWRGLTAGRATSRPAGSGRATQQEPSEEI